MSAGITACHTGSVPPSVQTAGSLSGPGHDDAKPVLLAVCTTEPWPVLDGYSVRVFNLLRELSRSWTIKLVAPPPPAAAEAFPPGVAEYLPVNLTGDGLAYPWRFSPELLRDAVSAATRRYRPERAIVWRGAEALWFDAPDLPPAVLDLIDCTPLDLWRGIVAQRSLRLRLRKLREIGIASWYARRAVRSFASVVCAGEQDRRWLRWIGGRGSVHTVLNGVRLPEESCSAATRATVEDDGTCWEQVSGKPQLSFIGTLDFEPNVDAVEFLVRDIWPRVRAAIPDAELILAGRRPTPGIHALHGQSGIEVQANVPDISRVLRRSWLSIAPMRSGVGVKNKILEAWASGRAVVLTPLASNGLAVPAGHESLIQPHPAELAATIIRLFQDPAELRRLGHEARQYAASDCGWESMASRLDTLLRDAEPRRLEPLDESRIVDRPTLFVVVDTEAEFDWSGSFARHLTSVSSIAWVSRGQAVLERYGLVPTYVVDFPIASQRAGFEPLRAILERGACAIGAHLHPWTTPPFDESVGEWNSYAGNLPPSLQERKLRVLLDEIERNFGQRTRFFKAGRYGVGRQTMEILARNGITVDFSIMPGLDLTDRGGPDFRAYASKPYLLDGVLSLPMTRAHIGMLAGSLPRVIRALDGRHARRLMLPALLVRTGLLNRVTLTPEGVSTAEQIALIRSRVAAGQKIFVLHYHSPSLMAGQTPYTRTEADVAMLLDRLSEVCRFFMEEMGGQAGHPTMLLERADQLLGRAAAPVSA